VELPKGGYLLICDEVPDVKRSRVFDVGKHSFNPLKGIDFRVARQLADLLYTVNPQGEDTLTVRNGKRALLRMLLENRGRLDKLRKVKGAAGSEEAGDSERRPRLSRPEQSAVQRGYFSFKPNSRILARLNRAELGALRCARARAAADGALQGSSSCPTSASTAARRMRASYGKAGSLPA
jgi:hypothetical protein